MKRAIPVRPCPTQVSAPLCGPRCRQQAGERLRKRCTLGAALLTPPDAPRRRLIRVGCRQGEQCPHPDGVRGQQQPHWGRTSSIKEFARAPPVAAMSRCSRRLPDGGAGEPAAAQGDLQHDEQRFGGGAGRPGLPHRGVTSGGDHRREPATGSSRHANAGSASAGASTSCGGRGGSVAGVPIPARSSRS